MVGAVRSGTTLLRLQLDAHPEIAIPSETGFGAVLAGLAADATADDLLASITALSTWSDLAVSRDELAHVFDSVEDWSAAAGLRAYYRWYAAKSGKPRWGDKTPAHADYMPVLAGALPEAHFVHIIRDGRDVAASLRDLPFAPGDGSIRAIATTWRDTITRARSAGAELPHYHEVRYERLVAEPEPALREICEFLDLEFDPAMLTAHERADDRLREMAVVDAAGGIDGDEANVRKTFSGVLRPPDTTRIGMWREALSAVEVAQFERIAGGKLAELGYQAARAARPGAPGGPSRAPGALSVVIGANAFDHPGGTETYVFTVARELQRLGHEPVVAATEVGAMAEQAERSGIPLALHEAELPQRCDALLVNDAIAGAALAERYPDARHVHVAHSDLYDHQLPVMASGVVDAVIVLSDRVARRIASLALDAPIVRLTQPIDTERFVPRGDIAERPRRALLLGNYLSGSRRRALVDAWQDAGVECVQVGAATGLMVDVAPQIADADIVVGKARAVLEGMSSARAAYVFDEYGGDGWVTPANYASLEADAFAGLASGVPREAADVARDLASYSRDMGWTNRELVKAHHAARRHAIALLEVLRGDGDPPGRPLDALADIARLTRLNWDSERRSIILHREAEQACAALRAEVDRLGAEAATLREQAAQDEADAAARHADALADVDAWRERAFEAERQVEEARALLGTRRAQVGLTLGRAIDRARGKR